MQTSSREGIRHFAASRTRVIRRRALGGSDLRLRWFLRIRPALVQLRLVRLVLLVQLTLYMLRLLVLFVPLGVLQLLMFFELLMWLVHML